LLADTLCALHATDWNLEAGEMVEEVIKTQKQVAELLCSHNQATSELEAMKESCTQEVSRRLYVLETCTVAWWQQSAAVDMLGLWQCLACITCWQQM
jgi:hypothetical protein